jgi:serine/threonine protein phosphatase PrpC
MYPGLHITRSFGDILAHDIGVISAPTIFHRYFENQDSYIIIATDGVWSNIEDSDV